MIEVLSQRIDNERQRNIRLEAYGRRNNVIIEGVREHDHEDCVFLVTDICENVLNLPNIDRYIDKAHRYGPRLPRAHRPIIVRFIYHQDADMVIARQKMAREVGIRIQADYPKEIQREHYLLEKVHILALRDGK